MKTALITTFSDKGYHEYGKYFLESCKKYLDNKISLHIYLDNIELESWSNVYVKNLEKSIPELTEFKKRHQSKKPESFMNDAVRFSHKSYCIYHASKNIDCDILFWLDSDTEIVDNIDFDFFKSLMPLEYFSSYLGRENYTETGFLGFNLTHKFSKEFFDTFKSFYDNDKIYQLTGQLDCHVYDATRLKLESEGKIKNLNLSPVDVQKNHFNTVFDGKIIHYKGERKTNRDLQLSKFLKRKIKNG